MNKLLKLGKSIFVGVLAITMLVGCGGSDDISGTYEITLAPDELAGQTSHNGFLSSFAAEQVNTLELKDDGTYEYTKEVHPTGEAVETAGDFKITYTFTGEYTNEDDVVTLAAPKDCEFDEKWGTLVDAGFFQNSKGSASNGDIVESKEDEFKEPLNLFLTPYYLDSKEPGKEVKITINKDDSSFKYSEEANSDDE